MGKDTKNQGTKVEQQEKEEAKRKAEQQQYDAADRFYKRRYIEQLNAELGVEAARCMISFVHLKQPLLTAEEEAIRGQPSLSTVDGKLPEYGKVDVYYGKDANKTKADFCLYYTADGIKSNKFTVESQSAGIDALILETNADTIVLNVAREPHNPGNEADALLMWMQLCIDKGRTAQLSDNAMHFVNSISDDPKLPPYLPPEKIAAIHEAIELSGSRLSQKRMEAAAEPTATKSYVVLDKVMLEGQVAKSQRNHDELAVKLPNDENKRLKLVEASLKELNARLKQLEIIQNRMENVRLSEKAIMANPELLAKADAIKSNANELDGKSPQKIAGSLIQKMKVPVAAGEADKRMALINKNNSPEIRQRKADLLIAWDAERQACLVKRNEMVAFINNNPEDVKLTAQKDKLLAEASRFDEKLGVDSALLAKHTVLQDWNAGNRADELAKATAPNRPRLRG